jgi:hypothetical protein
MSSVDTQDPTSDDSSSPSQDFAEFSREEKLRRVNSGQPMDRERYDRVVALIMDKLRALEVEE